MADEAGAPALSVEARLAAAVAQARAAEIAAAAPLRTDDEIVAEIDAANAAADANGIPSNTRVAIDQVKVKWQRFVARFGVTYGFDGRTPPAQTAGAAGRAQSPAAVGVRSCGAPTAARRADRRRARPGR